MSSASDSFVARLQAPYAGRVEEPSKGYSVTAFNELPFEAAGRHKVRAEGDKFWHHPAVVDATIWQPGSYRAEPVNSVIKGSSENDLQAQWMKKAEPLFEDFLNDLGLPVEFHYGREVVNLPAWQNIKYRVRSKPDIGVYSPADEWRPLVCIEFKKVIDCLGWTDTKLVQAYYAKNSVVVYIVRQVIQYAVTAGCYVVLVTNGFNLFAFRSEVVMEFCPETKVPQETLQVHVSNNISWKDVDPSITQAAAAVIETALRRGLGPDRWPAEGPRMPPDAPGTPPGPHSRALTGKQVGRPAHSPATAVGTSEGSGMSASASAACSLGNPAGGPELRCTFGSCDILHDGSGTSPTSSSSLADCSGVMEPALERCTPMASVGWGAVMEATLVRLDDELAVMKTLIEKRRRELSVDEQFGALAPTQKALAALSGSMHAPQLLLTTVVQVHHRPTAALVQSWARGETVQELVDRDRFSPACATALWKAATDVNSRGVAVGDEPGGRNYVLQRPLEEGPPVVVVVDLSHAITGASQQELDADLEAQLDFILSELPDWEVPGDPEVGELAEVEAVVQSGAQERAEAEAAIHTAAGISAILLCGNLRRSAALQVLAGDGGAQTASAKAVVLPPCNAQRDATAPGLRSRLRQLRQPMAQLHQQRRQGWAGHHRRPRLGMALRAQLCMSARM